MPQNDKLRERAKFHVSYRLTGHNLVVELLAALDAAEKRARDMEQAAKLFEGLHEVEAKPLAKPPITLTLTERTTWQGEITHAGRSYRIGGGFCLDDFHPFDIAKGDPELIALAVALGEDVEELACAIESGSAVAFRSADRKAALEVGA